MVHRNPTRETNIRQPLRPSRRDKLHGTPSTAEKVDGDYQLEEEAEAGGAVAFAGDATAGG